MREAISAVLSSAWCIRFCKIIGEGGGRALGYAAQAGLCRCGDRRLLGFVSPLPAGAGAGGFDRRRNRRRGRDGGRIGRLRRRRQRCRDRDQAELSESGGPFDGYADGTQTKLRRDRHEDGPCSAVGA